MFLTIIGGMIFVGQAWEWNNFIKGEYGAIETKGVVYFSLTKMVIVRAC
jgi:hypothetical protein